MRGTEEELKKLGLGLGLIPIAQDFLDSRIRGFPWGHERRKCTRPSPPYVERLPLIPSRRLLPVCPVEMDSSDSVSRNLGMLKIRFYL